MIEFRKFNSLKSFVRHFNNEQVCKDALIEARWDDDVVCPFVDSIIVNCARMATFASQ